MTTDVEFEGKTVKDALKRAGEALDLPADKIRYDIISYGSTGIFGLVGAKKAKIRVLDDPGGQSPVPRRKRSTQEIKKDILSTLDDTARKPATMAEDATDAPKRPNSGSRWQRVPNAEITPEIVQRSREALAHIAGAISDNITIIDECLNGRLVLNMVGGNSGALIGKRGQTLEAIQYLVEKIINKGRDDRVRIMVDVEGYLESRRANLKQLADRMAEKARKKGRPTTVGQMNAHDRRIIHLALKDDDSVRTQSVGDGHYRKLVIYPKNAPHRNKRGSASAQQRK